MSTAAKDLSPFFSFLLFSMCNCAVNWCDKTMFFCIYICCFIANSCHMTRWGSKQSHSHRAYVVIFSFLFWNLITNWYQSWPLVSRNVTIMILQGHATSSFTWPFDSKVVISYRCSIGTKSVSPTVVEIIGPKYIGVMTLTFLGHMTSSGTWPFESQWVISYWWSTGPN